VIEFIRNETTLMAYADGELDPGLAMALEEAMKSDPQLLSELVAFIRTRRMAKNALAARPDAVHSSSALDTLLQKDRTAVRPPGRRSPYPLLMAASIGIAAFVGGTLFNNLQPKGALLLLESEKVSQILNSEPTGAETDLDGRRIRLVGTFQAGAGLCREAEISGGSEERTNAVLCKSSGAWTPALTLTTRQRGYEPAAGSKIIENFLHDIGAQPLTADKELEVLAGGGAQGKAR
jgi:hypothetical protein